MLSSSCTEEIKTRPASEADLPRVLDICNAAWAGVWQGNIEMLQARVKAFPAMGIFAAEVNGVIEGYLSVQITDAATSLAPTWQEATDGGTIIGTHNERATWIHGVGVVITARGSRFGVADHLWNGLLDYMTSHKKDGIRFVTRLPRYERFESEMSVSDYVQATCSHGRLLDPELRTFGRFGLRTTNPPMIFDEYLGVQSYGVSRKSVLVQRLRR